MLKTNKDKYNDVLLKVALERNELFRFITGIGIYEITAPQGMNIGVDFSYSQVMDTLYRGLKKYPSLPNLVEEAFSYILINFKSDFIIRALNVLNYHMNCEKNGTATFKMDNIKLLQLVKNNIKINQDLFKNGDYPFWHDIEKMDNAINDAHGIHIL